MPSIKFHYFNIEGRGEIIRLIFAAGGVDYVDERIEQSDWPALKTSGKYPFDQLPVIEVDGRMIGQSGSNARFAARLGGIAGKTSVEQAIADEVADCFLHDLFEQFVVFSFIEKDETKKAELKSKYLSETLPFYLGKLEKILQGNGGQYFTGALTYADVAFYRFINVGKQFLELKPEPVKYPGLTALYKRISELPNIQKYESSKVKSDH